MKSKMGSEIKRLIASALSEDRVSDDITSRYALPQNSRILISIIAKERGVLCGIDLVRQVYKQIDRGIVVKIKLRDGSPVRSGQIVAVVSGSARSILSGERTALNFLQHLSGVATLTNAFVKKLRHSKTKIYDTRKTVPGLRVLQKYAVRCGGGTNHRMDLAEGSMLKDNHRKIVGCLSEAVRKVKKHARNVEVEVECETLDEVRSAMESGADVIMFDNMLPKTIKRAVTIVRKAKRNIETEISGGIKLSTVSRYRSLGVDRISVGALTHSAPALDFSIEVVPPRGTPYK